MVEVAKLSTLVERLISDVKAQDQKIDDLRHQATYIKGGLAVAVVVIGGAAWVFKIMLDGKWDAIAAAIAALQK